MSNPDQIREILTYQRLLRAMPAADLDAERFRAGRHRPSASAQRESQADVLLIDAEIDRRKGETP